MGCVSGVLNYPVGQPSGVSLASKASVMASAALVGNPVAPYVGVAVQPPECGVIDAGILVVVLPGGYFLVNVDVEAPLTQHVNDVGCPVFYFGIYSN